MSEKNKTKTLHYGLLHYHLKQGGVRTVMDNSILALGLYGGFEEIRLDVFANIRPFQGETGLFEVAEKGRRLVNVKVRNIDLNELEYSDRVFGGREEFLEEAGKIRDKILKNIDLNECSNEEPYILHCHNVPLGKSPAMTAAIKLLAEQAMLKEMPLWILNQVHDFAESRHDRTYSLQNCTGKKDSEFAAEIMYPNTPNVVYATINSNDAENLLEIGIPKERVFVLPNSINTKKFGKETSEARKNELLKGLGDYATGKGYFFDENKRILLAPVKAIRRKNIAESILLLSALNRDAEKYQLVVTLDANSPIDGEYSNALKRFIRKNRLHAIIGFGNTANDFDINELCSISEAVVTTSIMEGFGFAFHEAWLCSTLIVGRKLPYVTGDFEKNGLDLGHMYEALLVKVEWTGESVQGIIGKYREKKPGLEDGDFLEKKLVKKKGVDCIDFSDLDLGMQLSTIERLLSDKNALEEFLRLNPGIIETEKLIDENPLETIGKNREVVMEKYCLEAKAGRMLGIFEKGNKLYLEKGKPGKNIDNSGTIQKYMELKKVKLLY